MDANLRSRVVLSQNLGYTQHASPTQAHGRPHRGHGQDVCLVLGRRRAHRVNFIVSAPGGWSCPELPLGSPYPIPPLPWYQPRGSKVLQKLGNTGPGNGRARMWPLRMATMPQLVIAPAPQDIQFEGALRGYTQDHQGTSGHEGGCE